MPDDDFTPKLGRTRGKDGKRVVKYGGRILAAARLAGTKTGVRSHRFDGSRIGRGASIGVSYRAATGWLVFAVAARW